jgi:hypothetical protein
MQTITETTAPAPAVLSLFNAYDDEEKITEKLKIVYELGDEINIKNYLEELNNINLIKCDKVEEMLIKYLEEGTTYSPSYEKLDLYKIYLDNKDSYYKDNIINKVIEEINEQLIKLVIYLLYSCTNNYIMALIYKLYMDNEENIYLVYNKFDSFYTINYIIKYINNGDNSDLIAISYFYDTQNDQKQYIRNCVICFDDFKIRNLKKSFLDCCLNGKQEAPPVCSDCFNNLSKCPTCRKNNPIKNKNLYKIKILNMGKIEIFNGYNGIEEDEIAIITQEGDIKQYTIYKEIEFKIRLLNKVIEDIRHYNNGELLMEIYDNFKYQDNNLNTANYSFIINMAYNLDENQRGDFQRNFLNLIEDNENQAIELYNIIDANGAIEELNGEYINYSYEANINLDYNGCVDLEFYLIED